MLAVVTGTDDHVLRNHTVWDQWASSYAGPGLRSWSAAEPTWGIWGIPEAQAGVLPSGLEGAGSIELGCGTGYVSAWLARRGARPVALDNSPGQRVDEGLLTAADLVRSDEVLVTSTAGGVMPVTVVDGRPVGPGVPGPRTRKLRDLYWASHHDPRYSTPVRY